MILELFLIKFVEVIVLPHDRSLSYQSCKYEVDNLTNKSLRHEI